MSRRIPRAGSRPSFHCRSTLACKSRFARRSSYRSEDACRACKGNLPGVLVACNNLAISILRLLGHKNVARTMEELSRR